MPFKQLRENVCDEKFNLLESSIQDSKLTCCFDFFELYLCISEPTGTEGNLSLDLSLGFVGAANHSLLIFFQACLLYFFFC